MIWDTLGFGLCVRPILGVGHIVIFPAIENVRNFGKA